MVLPPGVLDGMMTLSTTPPPFLSRYVTFLVPSFAVRMSSSARSPSYKGRGSERVSNAVA